MARELSDLVKEAERAVAGMSDKALKTRAFELIMQELLQRGRHPQSSLAPRAGKGYQTAGVERKLPRIARGSLTQRLLELAEGGFFTQPRTSSEARAELQQHGYHYPENSVAMALLRLVRRRVMRRVARSKGKNPIYGYVSA